jgi:hypothetical protein
MDKKQWTNMLYNVKEQDPNFVGQSIIY